MTVFADRSPHRVGIAAGIGFVIMVILLGLLSTMSFGKANYSAYLEHTAGLRVGESVQVAGVDVGEITGIALGDGKVLVDFNADKAIRLGSRTTASVKVATLLGTHYLEIAPAGAGELDKATVPLSQTSVPYNLQDVVNAAGTTLEKFDGAKIAKSLTVVADALRGTPEAARAALEGVSTLSRVAAERSDQMRTLLSSTNEVTGQLAKNSEEIVTLLEQSNLVLSELVSRREAIDRMLVDSERLAKAIIGVIDDNEDEFEPLMDDLSTTLALLREHEAGLTESIKGLGTTARYFANATGNGPWMDLHLPNSIPDNTSCLLSPSMDCQ